MDPNNQPVNPDQTPKTEPTPTTPSPEQPSFTTPTTESVVQPTVVTPEIPSSPLTPTPTAEPTAPVATSEPTVVQPTGGISPDTTQPAVSEPVVSPVVPTDPTAMPSGGMVGGSVTPPVGTPKKSKKKPLLIALAAVVVVLLIAGFVFGIYLPNTPNGAYARSMDYSNRAYDMVTKYAVDQQKNPAKGAVVDGSFSFKAGGAAGDGTVTSKSYGLNSDSTINLNVIGQKFSLNAKSITAKDQSVPDIYVQPNGIKSILQGYGLGQYASLDGQWIAIDHTVLQSFSGDKSNAMKYQAPTQAQVQDALQKVGNVNRQYLFTTNMKKGVLQKQKNLGKSQLDGRTVFGYQMTYSKANLKTYSSEVVKALNSSSFNDWVKSVSGGKSIAQISNSDALNSQIDQLKDGYTFNLYVDAKTKLIRQVHFPDSKDPTNNYLNLGLLYDGGDDLPISFTLHNKDGSDTNNVKLVASLNTKTNKVTMDFNVDGTSGGSPISVTAKLNVAPSNDIVNVTAPTKSTPVMTLIQQLGLGGLLGGGSTTDTTTSSLPTDSTYDNLTFTQ